MNNFWEIQIEKKVIFAGKACFYWALRGLKKS
jgi:hypothetical protein